MKLESLRNHFNFIPAGQIVGQVLGSQGAGGYCLLPDDPALFGRLMHIDRLLQAELRGALSSAMQQQFHTYWGLATASVLLPFEPSEVATQSLDLPMRDEYGEESSYQTSADAQAMK